MSSLQAPEPTRTDEPEDRDLVARFRAGDSSAFDQIVAAHQERVTRLAFHLLGGEQAVEDVTQEVFLSVFENLKRFRGQCMFSTWVTTIVLNKCRSHGRRRSIWRLRLPWLARPIETMPQPGRRIEAVETGQQVRQAVQGLPVRYREPIVLRYFEELAVAEIGEILGISVAAVEVRLSRARGRLRKTLTPET
ncbi:MAG: sigma-70 family RNA polymerase sigma factor [Pirellulales bacterium]|nr:sigma-70 family RNA polymerase sigma factor [Pirellulales bacterium]